MTNDDLSLSSIQSLLPHVDIRWLDDAQSTNSSAKELLFNDPVTPLLVVAQNQTAGRGQHGKYWWSTTGSLTISLAIPSPEPLALNWLPIAAAIVVADCIATNYDQLKPKLKWPNDVFVNRRKVAGILVETIQRDASKFSIIGIGVNVNCEMGDAPAELEKLATSLYQESGSTQNLNCFIAHIFRRMMDIGDRLTRENILPQFSEKSLISLGSQIVVATRNGNQIKGQFAGIGENGELLIRANEEKPIAVVSASIVDYDG